MLSPTPRLIPATGLVAAACLLALGGCGGRPAPARTSSAPTGSSTPQAARQQTILTSGIPASPPSTSAGTITTTGTGTVSGAPDTMTVSVRVSTSDPHAAAALAQNNSITLQVQHALEQDGVAQKDIQTTDLSLQQTVPPSAAGFEADDEVSATLHDLTKAGSAIDDAVAAAGDAGRLDGVSFSMADSSPLMAAARQQAVAAAHTDAVQLAAAAGEHLVGLRSMTDQTNQGSPAAPMAGASAGAVPVPVQPGSQQLSVAVTAVWAVSG